MDSFVSPSSSRIRSAWFTQGEWLWALLLPGWGLLIALTFGLASDATGLWIAGVYLLLAAGSRAAGSLSSFPSLHKRLLPYGFLLTAAWLAFPVLTKTSWGYVGLYATAASMGALRSRGQRLILLSGLLLGQLCMAVRFQSGWDVVAHAVGLALLTELPSWMWRTERQEHFLQQQRAWQALQEQLQQEAYLYRMVDPSHAGVSAEGKVYGALQSLAYIQQTTLHLLCEAIGATRGAFLLAHPQSNQWIIKHRYPSDPASVNLRLDWDAGVLGQVIKQQTLVELAHVRANHLPYATTPHPDASFGFMGIPLQDAEGVWLGMVCVDRIHTATDADLVWTSAHRSLLQTATEQLLHAVLTERLVAWAERRVNAQSQVYAVSERLNRAQGQEQVYEVARTAADALCTIALSTITHYDSATQKHSIVSVHAPDLSLHEWVGRTFENNSGLVSLCIKNGMTLPALGVTYQPTMLLFDKPLPDASIQSVLVLPLICEGIPTGTWVLASPTPNAFDVRLRELLGVMANQLAISLENARRFHALEAMATTDGLTQLLNRRTWQDQFPDMLARAGRHPQPQPLSLLMTDVDFFKKVNDTQGHPAGDEVLRQVARVIKAGIRKVDLAARYGGEEFVVVLDGADAANAWQWADRVRQEVQALTFTGKNGTFQCTLSIGIATFPQDGTDETALTARADQALYYAKNHGRNQVIAFSATQASVPAGT